MQKILLIDNDIKFSSLLRNHLIDDNFDVEIVRTGHQALAALEVMHYDVILLDLLLPDMNGYDILKVIKETNQALVVICSAKNEDVDRILTLELGAEQFLSKLSPCKEIVAYLRALLRRIQTVLNKSLLVIEQKTHFTFKNLVLDTAQYTCHWRTQLIDFTYTEFCFLKLLIMHQKKVVKRQHLSEIVLGKPLLIYDRSVDVHISKIRHKLQVMTSGEITIYTIRRIGYRIQ